MIGIIGAMEEEVRELIADMQECEMNEKASMKCCSCAERNW